MASDLIGLMMARYLVGAEPLASLPPMRSWRASPPGAATRSGRADPAGNSAPPIKKISRVATAAGWPGPRC